MNFYDALYKIARGAGVSINTIGLALGKTDRYIPSAKWRKSIPSVTNAAKMLDVCGYRLCAVKEEEVSDSMVVLD